MLGIALMGGAASVHAKPSNVTAEEMRLIPAYCVDTMGFKYGDAYFNTSPRANHWVAIMGPGFWAMHHYCWGQIEYMRAMRSSTAPAMRKGLLESARGNYYYVVNNVPADFILLPEVLTRIGEVELRLALNTEAMGSFSRARELKPDYWPAYSHWAEFLIRQGKKAEARELVKTGLEYTPQAKVLIEQYRLLGGNPAEIVARPKPDANAENGDSPVTTGEAANAVSPAKP